MYCFGHTNHDFLLDFLFESFYKFFLHAWNLHNCKHLYYINSSLKFFYSRKQSQYLYLDLKVLHFFIIVSVFTFHFMNSLKSVANRTWSWSCHKPWTIKKLLYSRYIFCNLFSIFINSSSLFFYWDCNSHAFSS